MKIGAHLVEKGLGLCVHLGAGLLVEPVGKVRALGGGRLLHDLVDRRLLGDELPLQGVEIGTGAAGKLVAPVVGKRVDVHQDVVERAVVGRGVHGGVDAVFPLGGARVRLAPSIDGRVDVLVDLGEQGRVAGNGDAELGAREVLPLYGGDVRTHSLADLVQVSLDRAVVADGIETRIGVGVEAAVLLAACREGAQRLEQVHLVVAGGEEELGIAHGGHARRAHRVAALLERGAKVHATLRKARVLSGTGTGCAVRGGDIEGSVREVGGAPRVHGSLLQPLGVQAEVLVVEVDLILELSDVGVDRGLVGVGGRQVERDPLMPRELRKEPGLVVVRDDDLVAVVAAMLVDDPSQELDAVTRRGTAGQHDVGDGVLAQTARVVPVLVATGVDGLDLVVVVRGECRGDAHAPLVGARLGIGIGAVVPTRGEVAHIGVAIRRPRVRPLEVGLVG